MIPERIDVLVVLEGDFEVEIVAALQREAVTHLVRRCVDAVEARGAAAAGLGDVAVVAAHLVDPEARSDLERAGVRVVTVDERGATPSVDAVVAAVLAPADTTPPRGGAASPPARTSNPRRPGDPTAEGLARLEGAELAAHLPPDPFVDDVAVGKPAPPGARRYPPRARRRASTQPSAREEPAAAQSSDSATPPSPVASAPIHADSASAPSTSEPSGGDDSAAAVDHPCVVAIAGPAGSPGRTTLTLALAHRAARRGLSTLVIDADTLAPGIVYLLGLSDESAGVAAAAYRAQQGEIDEVALADLVEHTGWGFDVLTGIGDASRWREISVEAVDALLAVARRAYDLVLVDTAPALDGPDAPASYFGPGRDDARRGVLEAADRTVVVGAGDPLGMRRLVAYVRDFPCDTCEVVVNRLDRAGSGVAAERGARHILARYAHIERSHIVRRDTDAAARAVLDARPVSGGGIGEDVEALLDAVVAPRPPEEPRTRAGWLRMLLSRSWRG